MAEVNNRAVLERIEKEAFAHPFAGGVPRKLNESIQPVLVANPKEVVDIVKEGSTSATATSTIYTTPANADFYLTSTSLSITKDVNNDNTNVHISVVLPTGESVHVTRLMSQTLTADSHSILGVFNPPIKVKRGSNVTLGGAFAAGTMTKNAIITGFVVEGD